MAPHLSDKEWLVAFILGTGACLIIGRYILILSDIVFRALAGIR